MFAPYPADRLHNQHPPPPASNQSRQSSRPEPRGSILDAGPPPQGVKVARRNTSNGSAMSLNKKRPLAALYFANRIIQRNFPLRTFTAPNVGNSFMGAHSFSSANALFLHGVRHPSLPIGALTVAVALLTSRLSSVW